MRIAVAIAALVLVGTRRFPAPAHAGEAVDAIVVLAADVSRSINDDEFALQRRGYAAAIVSPKLMEAIARPAWRDRALLCRMGGRERAEDRRRLEDRARPRRRRSLRRHARRRAARLCRPHGDRLGDRLRHAAIGASGFSADRKVIDVSGDGTSNQGRPAPEARDAAVAAGAVINGLAIFNRSAAAQSGYLALHTNPPGGLAQYYRDNVIGGPGAFVLPIDDFGKFSEAMIRKLISEIASGAAPATGG